MLRLKSKLPLSIMLNLQNLYNVYSKCGRGFYLLFTDYVIWSIDIFCILHRATNYFKNIVSIDMGLLRFFIKRQFFRFLFRRALSCILKDKIYFLWNVYLPDAMKP